MPSRNYRTVVWQIYITTKCNIQLERALDCFVKIEKKNLSSYLALCQLLYSFLTWSAWYVNDIDSISTISSKQFCHRKQRLVMSWVYTLNRYRVEIVDINIWISLGHVCKVKWLVSNEINRTTVLLKIHNNSLNYMGSETVLPWPQIAICVL